MRKSFRNFREYINYLRACLELIEDALTDLTFSYEEVTQLEGIVRGTLVFLDGSKLDFLEYVVAGRGSIRRLKYRYNYVDSEGNLVFRYDNTPHHRDVPTFPHHKHVGEGRILPSSAPFLEEVIHEVLRYVKT